MRQHGTPSKTCAVLTVDCDTIGLLAVLELLLLIDPFGDYGAGPKLMLLR